MARPSFAPVLWPLLGLLLLCVPLAFEGRHAMGMASQMGIAVLACLSFHVLWGQGGLLSFGHAVYTGAGAYLCMHTLQALSAHTWPLPVVLLPLLAGAGTALLALPLGWLSTRRPGTPFAMITLGVGELVWALALMWPAWSGGESGLSGNRAAGPRWGAWDLGRAEHLYLLIAAHTALGVALVWGLTQTTFGRLLNAVRDNPLRVPLLGYDPQRLRLMAFVFAAFLAGISGALAALHQEIVTPEVFSIHRSGNLLLFTLLGGATLLGPVLGGVLMVAVMVGLSSVTPAWLLYTGLVFMLGVVWAPDGVAGLLQRGWLACTQGRWRPSPRWAGRLLAALCVLAGGVALVEMAYQLPQHDTLGAVRQLAGLALDTRVPAAWAAACGLLLLGVVLWWVARPRQGPPP
ncbi:MAG: branched-chain amino acid ABC transporter permease [Hydrogenophaga sp.]|nr:branched-chain amino acid ABC transporter permease [Hydrogenophaga sp.]